MSDKRFRPLGTRQFPLPPLGKFPLALPVLLGLVLPLAIVAAFVLVSGADREWLKALPALLALPVVAGLLAWSMHSRRVELLPGQIRVRQWPIPRGFALSDIELDAARVEDLDQNRQLQPVMKLIGSRLPGFRSGWFWLRDKRRAYVLCSSGSRVLCLPRRDGSVLLLGVERPDDLLQALRHAEGGRS